MLAEGYQTRVTMTGDGKGMEQVGDAQLLEIEVQDAGF